MGWRVPLRLSAERLALECPPAFERQSCGCLAMHFAPHRSLLPTTLPPLPRPAGSSTRSGSRDEGRARGQVGGALEKCEGGSESREVEVRGASSHWWAVYLSSLKEVRALSATKMGKGGKAILAEDAVCPVERAPATKPPFTVGEIKRAIPPHCFKRSIPRSFSYLIADLAIIALAVYSTKYFVYGGLLNWAMWTAYWVVTGCVATGVWVIAHECGHHAFSDYQWLDDTVGLIFHSLLMVPYFSWKYSHRRHHSNTGSVDKDEVFVPKMKEEFGGISKYLQHPPGRLIQIVTTLTLGWPLYLIFNVSGRKYERPANHFNTHSPIFVDRERFFIFVSDISLLAVVGLLYRLYSAFGLAYLVKMYFVPLLIVNGFLVLITFLQHTHAALPHYDGTEWDWLRGALATMDRDYGVLNHVLHHITDTHVAHHLFSTMPHYHAQEATEAIKPILGKYYQMDRTPVLIALWREHKECVYVDKDSDNKEQGVLWYKNKVE